MHRGAARRGLPAPRTDPYVRDSRIRLLLEYTQSVFRTEVRRLGCMRWRRRSQRTLRCTHSVKAVMRSMASRWSDEEIAASLDGNAHWSGEDLDRAPCWLAAEGARSYHSVPNPCLQPPGRTGDRRARSKRSPVSRRSRTSNSNLPR